VPIQGLVTAGWLAVFAAGPDGTLGYMRQTERNNVWSQWEELGPAIIGDPAVFHNADGRLEVFAKGPSGLLGHMWQSEPDGPWSDWEDVGPAIAGDPVVFHNADGHLEVFARGAGGPLGHMWQTQPDHGWSDWEEIGPPISGNPALFQNAGGHLEIFAIGPEGRLGHQWQTTPNGLTGWSSWEELGPEMTGNPILFLNTDGNLEVFARGPDGLLGHRWQTQPDHGWSDWEAIGPALAGDPVVFQNADGHLEVFARGPEGTLGHQWQVKPDHYWSEWHDMGPELGGDPAVFQNADGRLEVFAVGAGGLLGHRHQHTPSGIDGWSDWEDLGPAITARRPAVGQTGTVGGADLRARAEAEAAARAPGPPAELTADFCVIGAGPAGVTVADGLIRAGASVVLIESGGLDENPQAQELNDGLADGPIIKRRWTYLRDGRRRAVQGSASRWGPGFCMPFRASDLEQRPWVADSGWPLTPEQLAPYETRAAETFGFEPFGPPPAEGPLVRLSYRFPPDPQLFRSRYLDLLTRPSFHPELDATAVELRVRGDEVESVRMARGDGGETRVTANTFVLAAGGVENARMLLLHDRALGPSAMTGRCFMEHPHVLAGRIVLKGAEDFVAGLEADSRLDVLALDDATMAAEGLLNASIQVRRLGPANGNRIECDLYLRAEQAPNPDSRVVLGKNEDRYGNAQPVLHWRLLEQDWASVARTTELVATALQERFGGDAELLVTPSQPWPYDPVGPAEAQNSTWGNHHMGTTRMGSDPGDSVVDPDCRLHGTGNLYVAGSSLFPTGSCANPTFTIVALAHRLVDHLSSPS
jgi:GMC oxidoreductase